MDGPSPHNLKIEERALAQGCDKLGVKISWRENTKKLKQTKMSGKKMTGKNSTPPHMISKKINRYEIN